MIIALLLAVGSILPPTPPILTLPPAPLPVSRRPVPIAPATWIGEDDYPPQALRNREAGAVGVHLEIGANGMVSKCTVTQSVTLTLDAETCKLLISRGRFLPATDAAGQPVAGINDRRIVWGVAADGVKSEQLRAYSDGAIRAMILIDAEGKIGTCFTGDYGTPPPDPGICADFLNREYLEGVLKLQLKFYRRVEARLSAYIPGRKITATGERIELTLGIARDGRIAKCGSDNNVGSRLCARFPTGQSYVADATADEFRKLQLVITVKADPKPIKVPVQN